MVRILRDVPEKIDLAVRAVIYHISFLNLVRTIL